MVGGASEGKALPFSLESVVFIAECRKVIVSAQWSTNAKVAIWLFFPTSGAKQAQVQKALGKDS